MSSQKAIKQAQSRHIPRRNSFNMIAMMQKGFIIDGDIRADQCKQNLKITPRGSVWRHPKIIRSNSLNCVVNDLRSLMVRLELPP